MQEVDSGDELATPTHHHSLTFALDLGVCVDLRIFKNQLLERVFEKMVSNLSVLEGIFEGQISKLIFFLNKIYRDFSIEFFFHKNSLVFSKTN